MVERSTRIGLAATIVAAGVVLAACGGRFHAGSGGSGASPAASATDAADAGVPASTPIATPLPSSNPSAGPANSASPVGTSKPASRTAAPVPTPNLAQLEQLLDQLDDALAADGAAAQDEGSPQ